MVNFNFGLGGLMGDDKKKDDNANPVDDNATAQDDSTQPDTSQQDTAQQDAVVSADETLTEPVAETSAEESAENSADENPAAPRKAVANFDSTDESTGEVAEETATEETPAKEEGANEPVFDTGETASEETAEANPFATDTPVAEEATTETSGITNQADEESWLNNDDSSEPVSLDAETPAMPTFGQPTDETPAESSEEAVSDEATAETSETADTPAMPDFTPAPAAVEEPTETMEAENTVDENPAKNEENPFPEPAVPVVEGNSTEPTAPASNEPFIPAVPKAQTSILETPAVENKEEAKEESALPEIPTFGQPADETPVKTTDENPAAPRKAVANLAETTETPAPKVPDFLSGANNDTAESSTNDLFATTDEPVAEENPLAPAPMATIGEVEATSPAETLSDEDFGLTETAENDLGVNTSQDDTQGDDDDAQSFAEKMTKNPVATLEEFKKSITKFAEEHNSKIEEYNQQIAELKAKIREEKHILREEQKKSAKILEDLNNLVANFSQTKPIKKKAPKKVNNHKFTAKK